MSDAIDLFPFLSIMLCIVGVLAFTQIVMVSIGSPKIRLELQQGKGSKMPYSFFCYPEGATAVPPHDGLQAIEQAATGHTRDRIAAIRQARAATRERASAVGSGRTGKRQTIDQKDTDSILEEVRFLNAAARLVGVPYEEFVLFGIYPGGGGAYHRIRESVNKPINAGIYVGLDPLDPTWIAEGSP